MTVRVTLFDVGHGDSMVVESTAHGDAASSFLTRPNPCRGPRLPGETSMAWESLRLPSNILQIPPANYAIMLSW